MQQLCRDVSDFVSHLVSFPQNMSDAMAVLHKLQTGLDVNVKFTGVRVFEYTPECIVFDLLDIPLYHGWLVDPQVRPKLPPHRCSPNPLQILDSGLFYYFFLCPPVNL